MKLSKLEAYRLYMLEYHVEVFCTIYKSDRDKILSELDNVWVVHCSKIDRLPKSSPTLVFMKEVILASNYIQKYLPKI